MSTRVNSKSMIRSTNRNTKTSTVLSGRYDFLLQIHFSFAFCFDFDVFQSSFDEIVKKQEQFLQMDINGDGFLSIEEALNVAGSEEEKVYNFHEKLIKIVSI